MKTLKTLTAALAIAAAFGSAGFAAGWLKADTAALERANNERAALRVQLIRRGLAGYNRETGAFELADFAPLPLPAPLPLKSDAKKSNRPK